MQIFDPINFCMKDFLVRCDQNQSRGKKFRKIFNKSLHDH